MYVERFGLKGQLSLIFKKKRITNASAGIRTKDPQSLKQQHLPLRHRQWAFSVGTQVAVTII